MRVCNINIDICSVIVCEDWVGGGHVACMGQKIHAGFCWENLKEGDWLIDLYLDERII